MWIFPVLKKINRTDFLKLYGIMFNKEKGKPVTTQFKHNNKIRKYISIYLLKHTLNLIYIYTKNQFSNFLEILRSTPYNITNMARCWCDKSNLPTVLRSSKLFTLGEDFPSLSVRSFLEEEFRIRTLETLADAISTLNP